MWGRKVIVGNESQRGVMRVRFTAGGGGYNQIVFV